MSDNNFYITTAIAYANASPHIGHAFEYVTADVHARHAKSLGKDVYFVTGMDEHGQKIQEKAKTEGVDVQSLVDKYTTTFKELDRALGVEYDFFVRTSDKERHYKGAQMLWNKLAEKGDLEKRVYKALYCVGCEEFKTEKDLNEKGECLIHLKVPEVVEEENYFFTLSKYAEIIKGKIQSDELKIYPEARKNEILALIERGLEDVSFSRPKSKVSWGIPVPGDESQVMYVWCDALSNYITALGYGTDDFNESLWSSATHVIGKDILRFHSAIWPGMLLSAGLPLPKRILVHGHITSGGQKMSKSIGNVIDPEQVLDLFEPATEYAGEALRFVLLHEVPSFEDGDLTMDSIKSVYTSYLVNGIGNMTSRIMKLATMYGVTSTESKMVSLTGFEEFDAKVAINSLTTACNHLDKKIQGTEPFKVVKVDEAKGKEMINELVSELHGIAQALDIFMPETSAKIIECIRENKMPEKPLFGRLS